MSRPILFGASYSVYVRIPRLVMAERGIDYDLIEVDIFQVGGPPTEYRERHPFGRIPAFEHDGFRLFETDAIVGYILDQFGDGGLLPQGSRERARMRQIMRVMDNYGYRDLVWGIYVEEAERGRANALKPEEIARAHRSLDVLADLATEPYLVGDSPTLADLWVLPMLAYLNQAPTGRTLLGESRKLGTWLARMQSRPSVLGTRFRLELGKT